MERTRGVKPRLVIYPKTHVFNRITLTFLYRNIFLNKPNKGKWILVLSAPVYSQVEPKEVWLTFLCAGWKACSFTQPFQPASFLSCQGLTACSLHLLRPLPDGFCLALSFLGTASELEGCWKQNAAVFLPTGGGLGGAAPAEDNQGLQGQQCQGEEV